MSKQEPVIIGIDLGTYKTAVMTSSGRRESFQSVVGWPKDRVARKVIGRDVLIGSKAMEHRLAVELVRPFEKGVLKYNDPVEAGLSQEQVTRHRQAARLLVEHAVRAVKPPSGRPLYGVIGTPATASPSNRRYLIEAAENIFDRVLVVSEPFAVAFAVDQLSNALIVDIGAGTIDICPMCGAYPDDENQVTVPLGGDVIDEELLSRLSSEYPDVLLSLNMARELKEKYGFVRGMSEGLSITLPTKDGSQRFDIAKPMREACRVLVAPLIDGIRKAVAKVDPEFRPRVLSNIILSGGGSQLRGLDWEIEEQLTDHVVKVTRVYDSMYAGAMGAYRLALGMPNEQWEIIERLPEECQEEAAPAAA
jgi:rod shape-determining protein MreB